MALLPENFPNEPGSWDADFRYAYLARLYDALRTRFSFARLGDAEQSLAESRARGGRLAFVRHDVDVSLDRALALARREAEWRVPATYHVMIDSPFYDVRASASLETLRAIAGLGHEIGIHYDAVARRTRDAAPEARAADIAAVCDAFTKDVGLPVTSVSFHLPVPDLIKGPLRVAGRVSGYAAALTGWYLSDSRARWREGEPIARLDAPRGDVLQILIHPVWWGETNERPEIRLRDFLLERAAAESTSFESLREKMWNHILYRAAAAPT